MRSKTVGVLSVSLVTLGIILLQARRPFWKPSVNSTPVAGEASGNGPNLRNVGELSKPSAAKLVADYGRVPLSFETNQGQTSPEVRFLSRGSGYTLFLTSTEAVLSLRRMRNSGEPASEPRGFPISSKRRLAGEVENTKLGEKKHHVQSVLRMKLVGANAATQVEGLDTLPGKSNYFIGNDSTRWRTNVPTYAKVRYEGVYPGVNLVYYGNQQQLEYDFVVAPGADPEIIRLATAGAEKLEAGSDGDLILRTTGGEIRLHKPVVYQEDGGVRKEIAGRYVLRGKRQIGFEVAAYDAGKPLIIDPVLSYSTRFGASFSARDSGNAIAVDSSGNAYVTGQTFSTGFPTTNPFQKDFGGGNDGDAFVLKLDPTGSALVYSTYLGGAGADSGRSIAVDASGNAYVTGQTLSTNFPTASAFQASCQSCASGQGDAFVAKLNAAGSALVYSTYLGGNDTDFANSIAVDSTGSAYLTGGTSSTNFPTKNPLQSVFGHVFVTKLDPTGSALVYSTFLGGSGSEAGNGIAVDSAGDAYVTGTTGSANFATKNPFQAALGGGLDAFVAKLDPTGSALVYSTFLGGNTDDAGDAIAVDSSGNAYVTGSTQSTNFPTASPFQASCKNCAKGQPGNAFVTKLNAAGSALVYSTYLGGNGAAGDIGRGIGVDASGNAYVAGFTSSPDFPLASPIQSSFVVQNCPPPPIYYYGYGPSGPYAFPCGNTAFVTKLNPAGSALVYSTYVGASGGNFEDGRGIAVDTAGNAYVTGHALSNFPVTTGAFQAPGDNPGVFVAKISPNDAPGFSLTSFSLAFPDEGIGGTTAAQTITLANTGSATLSITSIGPSGDFAATNTCGSSVAGGTSCAISVTFTPTAAGARTGAITITDSAASSPQKVTLTGNGIAGLSATLTPLNLSFANQTQGTTSALQRVTLTNTGSAALTINSFSVGGTNPSDFALFANCESRSLPVGASCTFDIAFAPQAVGNRSATLLILDNSAQSPRSVPLTGVGLAPPTAALSPTSLNFPAQLVGSTSPPQTITLSTTGSGTLAISSISASTGDFNPSNNCGASVAGGASCTITVTFAPTAPGDRTGMLVIASNAANGTQMVSLTGVGLAPPPPTGTDFSISPAVGSSSSATVTAGQSASYTVSAVGTSGFSGTVSLSCSDPAPQSACGVSPNSLMVNGTTAANATVTVTTTARSALLPRRRPPIITPGLRIVLLWLLLLLSLGILTRALRQRSRRQRAWLGVAAMLMAVALFFGCGGGGGGSSGGGGAQGTPAGAYQITVTATSAGASRTTTLSLTVR